MIQYSRLSSVMEASVHLKNGTSPKSLISKGIFVFFTLLTAAMMMFFIACDNNELDSKNDSNLEIIEDPTSESPFVIKVNNVENGTNNIVLVKSSGIAYCSTDNEWHYLEFSTEYKNGGFVLNFPVTIPDEYLQFAYERVIMDGGVIVSDTQAKITPVMLLALNSNEAFMGRFSFKSDNWSIGFIYADRSFTEKGISKYAVEFDCSYKKGWNIVYTSKDGEIADAGSTCTTQKPINEYFKCYFGL